MDKINFFQLSNFTPKQLEAFKKSKEYKFFLFGGSAGSGKSRFLRWVCLYYALFYAKKYNVSPYIGLFCKTYKELEDRHLKYVRTEFPDWLGTFYEQKHEFQLKPEYGGGLISFRNLDEPEKFYSVEFALIAVDEITEIPFETFKILLTRLRFSGIEETKFICASNPSGEHMLWVRQFFVEKNLPPEFDKDQFFYLPALPTDNPYLPSSYFEQLKSLPEAERKAFLEGDWYAFENISDIQGYIPLITSKDLQNSFIEEEYKLFELGDNIIGVDIGAGGDKTAIVIRNDIVAKIIFNQKLSDTMQIIPILSNFLVRYKVLSVCIDTIGVGKGVYDRLKEIGFTNITKSVVFGEKPEKEGFFDKRANLFWDLKDWILRGGKLVKNEDWNQLLTLRYKILSDKKIRIISKDELRKQGVPSPDVADALALTFAVNINVIKSFNEMIKETLTF